MVHEKNPAELIKAHFEQMLAMDTANKAGAHPLLQFELIDVVRCEGDWLAAVVTPWAIQLLLLNGGGRLWGDIPAGKLRYVSMPGAVMQFIAETDDELGAWQYASLIDDIDEVADMAAARLVAQDSLQTALGVLQMKNETPLAAPAAHVSRRGFFRRLAGKRD